MSGGERREREQPQQSEAADLQTLQTLQGVTIYFSSYLFEFGFHTNTAELI